MKLILFWSVFQHWFDFEYSLDNDSILSAFLRMFRYWFDLTGFEFRFRVQLRNWFYFECNFNTDSILGVVDFEKNEINNDSILGRVLPMIWFWVQIRQLLFWLQFQHGFEFLCWFDTDSIWSAVLTLIRFWGQLWIESILYAVSKLIRFWVQFCS